MKYNVVPAKAGTQVCQHHR